MKVTQFLLIIGSFGAENEAKRRTRRLSYGEAIDFSLDIMCCDPGATDCEECITTNDTVPVIRIGPKSKADSSKVVIFLCLCDYCLVLSCQFFK